MTESSFGEFLTVADVATILKLNQQTVRNWIDQGTLPALRVGRRVRIRRSDFDEFIAAAATTSKGGLLGQGEISAQGFWDGIEQPTPVAPGEPVEASPLGAEPAEP